ncbi:MAG: sigma-70 family RNA polymerase sigma factor [Planctomycetales bacterium]|nr:sigma-70 family RNA polymerase sigma factor [Planctomycetales bacterium]
MEPETRESLLRRVRGCADDAAWDEFVSLYWPVVYRLARRRGMQHADAQDLAQQVLLAVSSAIPRWEPRDGSGKFRHWLARVAKNAILNALMRGPRDRATGGTTAVELLREQASADDASSAAIEWECRRERFRQAARLVRQQVDAATWQAFWLTTVEARGVEETAAALNKSIGSVYAARSRVMRRLRDAARRVTDENDE